MANLRISDHCGVTVRVRFRFRVRIRVRVRVRIRARVADCSVVKVVM